MPQNQITLTPIYVRTSHQRQRDVKKWHFS